MIGVLIIEELLAEKEVETSLPFCNCHPLLVDVHQVVVDENLEEILKLKKFKKCALARSLSGISLAHPIPVSSASCDVPQGAESYSVHATTTSSTSFTS